MAELVYDRKRRGPKSVRKYCHHNVKRVIKGKKITVVKDGNEEGHKPTICILYGTPTRKEFIIQYRQELALKVYTVVDLGKQ